MHTPPSKIAERARALLAAKDAQGLPDASKLRDAAAAPEESSSDAFLSVLVEAAYLVAAADGVVSPDESRTLAETIAFVIGDAVPASEFAEMLDAFAQTLKDDGLDKRIEVIAEIVPDEPARREALAFASLIGLCDHELVESEKDTLTRIGAAFSLDAAAVQAIIDSVAASLEALAGRGQPLPRQKEISSPANRIGRTAPPCLRVPYRARNAGETR
jgi:tellurite resistance protein